MTAVLVTGARRGIGAAIAIGFAQRGITVFVHHLGAGDEAAAVAAECRARGAAARVVEADLARPAEIAQLVNDVEPLDVLVNNAARPSNVPWPELTVDEWEATIAVNLTAPMLLAQAVLPGMIARGRGRIVNITSATVTLGGPSGAAYVAAKAGLVGLTRSLARQVKVEGVTVNAVSPGAVLTDNERELYSTEEIAAVEQRLTAEQSLPRRLVADDLVGVVQFLCSPAADAVTGQTIEVNGGWFFR